MSKKSLQILGASAKNASIALSACDLQTRNQSLTAIANALDQNREFLKSANEKDIARSTEEGLAAPLLKRLSFDDKKIDDVIKGIRDLTALADPIGKTLLSEELDRGLDLYRVSCPIGVIGIVFESRPDAFVQISTLCLKSGNAVLLKGGREALETNRALYKVINEASIASGLPEGWIQLLETRNDVNEMLSMNEYIDLIIPRGSNTFVRYIMDHTSIPVMGHSDGLCHVYVDKDANVEKAVNITVDSKTQSVAVCNAAETLLIHKDAAQTLLPPIAKALTSKGVELRGDEKARKIIQALPASEEDWSTEYLDYIISIKVVNSIDEAIDHINRYGSKHTDTIVTENKESADHFLTMVDSAGVYWNCSTRFADGYRYGFGAEVGISTSKIHARGPVGLDGLVSYKYKLIGHGQIVEDYSNGSRHFTHRPLNKDFSL